MVLKHPQDKTLLWTPSPSNRQGSTKIAQFPSFSLFLLKSENKVMAKYSPLFSEFPAQRFLLHNQLYKCHFYLLSFYLVLTLVILESDWGCLIWFSAAALSYHTAWTMKNKIIILPNISLQWIYAALKVVMRVVQISQNWKKDTTVCYCNTLERKIFYL